MDLLLSFNNDQLNPFREEHSDRSQRQDGYPVRSHFEPLPPPSPSSVLDSARGAEVWEINVYKLGMDANGNVGLGLLPMKSVLILDLRL